ncbi:UNVERIFIED_CONTAM: hypothetical protein Sangu_2608000 [Sesamum angustifolium]|uniref:Endonuclease/exonuclease/phosphatase domain-containing protein n=1 Tax=Sesamum angustifolium TaxID=2727405 RepID=A0AAW2J6S7_9LAMI
MVFLAETKCNSRKLELIKGTLNMFGLSVDAIGRSGGLALLWNKQVHVDLLSFSKSHIDARVKLTDEESYWRFTGFYGAADASQRSVSWNLLRHLSTVSNLPWLCASDFNAILSDTEKKAQIRHYPDISVIFEML